MGKVKPCDGGCYTPTPTAYYPNITNWNSPCVLATAIIWKSHSFHDVSKKGSKQEPCLIISKESAITGPLRALFEVFITLSLLCQSLKKSELSWKPILLRPGICIVGDGVVSCPNLPSGTETLISSVTSNGDRLWLTADGPSRTCPRRPHHPGT